MSKTAVIGHPISHSKSPLIHNYWIAKYGLSGSYGAIDIAPEDLLYELPRLIKEEGYQGFNVTIPHKENVMALCDEISPEARSIGAVNTLYLDESGHLIGTNTDAYGFIENIRQTLPSFDFKAGPAMILGAGGAARALLYGLLKEGAPEIYITNRTREKAENLKEQSLFPQRVQVIDWERREKALSHVQLLVNSTALGMSGKEPLEMDLSALPVSACVCDIVYAPLETRLLKDAKARGNEIVTGIGMLLYQARPGFKHWHGILPEVTPELEEKVLKS